MKNIVMKFLFMTTWLLVHVAWADDVQLTGFDEDSIPELTQPESERNVWHFIAGAGLASIPHYEGASQHQVRLVPLIEAHNSGFFAGTLGGIGYRIVNSRTLQFGVRISAAPGRREYVDAHLTGIGNLKASGEAGLFLKTKFGHGYFNGKLSGGARGSRVELGTGIDVRASETDLLRMGVNANWATTNYMQAYFGVDASQSASSGLPVYDAAGGLHNYGASASWSHIFNRHWLSNLAFTEKMLTGSARLSPLVQSESSHNLSCVAIYQF